MPATQVTRGYGLLEGFLAKQRIKIADSLIPNDARQGRVLDIGCGSYPLFLMTVNFSNKYGLDKVVQANQVDYFKANQISLINHDGEKEHHLPFEDNYFDIVAMLAVFEHIEPIYLVDIVAEIRRILKPGGQYILTTPALWADKLLRVMAKLHLVSPVEIEEHKDAYTHAKIAQILTKAGFKAQQLKFGYFEAWLNIWASATK